jgi:hypothetical protein
MTNLPQPMVYFDEALRRAIDFAVRHAQELGGTPLLVRDIYGRIRMAIDDRPPAPPLEPAALEPLAAKLHQVLGAYSHGDTVEDIFLLGRQLIAPDALFQDRDAQPLVDHPRIRLLERQLTGQDWHRPPFETTSPVPRATVYGIKGGVGRSTALTIWAQHLANQGRRVLVVDLDLESPGVSSMLLPEAHMPRFGLIDYFVEDEVGQGEELIPQIHRSSPLPLTEGEILVAPAYGARLQTDAPDDYLAKLARVYLGKPESDEGFAARLHTAIHRLEEHLKPDVVLLDSRAGLHDIAAVAVTRLQALALLFAINTPQTFAAYRLLFQSFRARPQLLAGFRDKLQVVAAQVPEIGRERYLEELKDRMHALFAKNIYDDEDETPEAEAFNFSPNDEAAPHSPIPIYWYRWFQDLDLAGHPEIVQAAETQAAFGSFLERATELLLADEAHQ